MCQRPAPYMTAWCAQLFVERAVVTITGEGYASHVSTIHMSTPPAAEIDRACNASRCCRCRITIEGQSQLKRKKVFGIAPVFKMLYWSGDCALHAPYNLATHPACDGNMLLLCGPKEH